MIEHLRFLMAARDALTNAAELASKGKWGSAAVAFSTASEQSNKACDFALSQIKEIDAPWRDLVESTKAMRNRE